MTEPGMAPDVEVGLVKWKWDTKVRPTNQGSARFVPYLDASTIGALLDQWVGPFNWRDRYREGVVAGKPVLWCDLEVRMPGTDEWVLKSDVGLPAGGSGVGTAEKGAVSDAFKRAACLKWGAGRNVYHLPGLWAPARVVERDGRTNAYADDRTVPALLKQLAALGYDVETTEVGDEYDNDVVDDQPPPPGVDAETGEVRQPPAVADASERAWQTIVDLVADGRATKTTVVKLARQIAADSGITQPRSFDDIPGRFPLAHLQMIGRVIVDGPGAEDGELVGLGDQPF